jgi:hypothetical protein
MFTGTLEVILVLLASDTVKSKCPYIIETAPYTGEFATTIVS